MRAVVDAVRVSRAWPLGRWALATAAVVVSLTDARADFPYEASIAPTGDSDLDSALAASSQLETLSDRVPAAEATLRSRAAADRDRLTEVAQAFGYYDAVVDIGIDVGKHPAEVKVTVDKGPQYLLSKETVIGSGGKPLPPAAPALTPSDLGIAVGGPAIAAPIAAANGKIEHAFKQHGFPFARVANLKAVADHGTKRIEVTYEVDPGPFANFGPSIVNGLDRVDPVFVARRLNWGMGQTYDVGLVDKTRDALVSSNLFSTIRVAPVPQPDVTGAVPMEIDLLERPPRSISAGGSYASTEGVSANASWEHHNLLGDGEDLRLSAIYGQEDKGLSADFREPDKVGDGWDLVSRAAFEDEHAIAYTSHRERIFGGIEYTGFRQLAVGFGLQLEHGIIDDFDLQQHYTLIGVPLTLRRDTTDDLLNPTVGDREDVALTPYVDPMRPTLHFLSGKVKGSLYQKLGDDDQFVLAGFAAIGSTVGVGLTDLPKDKRWYAGGGGSIRGYGFQLAGPLGSHEEPMGGLSSFESSIELRYKITQTIGVVPFLDAGNVYSSDFPDFNRRLFIGAGVGVRYYTALGPLRLDLATPLHARNVDRPIQIYVSIGQAF